jgi:hypothetical protein
MELFNGAMLKHSYEIVKADRRALNAHLRSGPSLP